MKKEIVIVSVILVVNIILNIICQKYTDKTTSIMDDKIEELVNISKLALENNSHEYDNQINGMIEEINLEWKKYNNNLSLYIEHDELEKVDTSLVTLTGYIELSEYDEAIPEMRKCIFILNHIKEKEIMRVTNLF